MPAAQSPGRTVVIARLKQLGKEQFRYARESAADGCAAYTFAAKVLLDFPALFSLQLDSREDCGGSVPPSMVPLLFEMRTGQVYDISRLYLLRDGSGALKTSVRQLIARRIDPTALNMTPQELADAVSTDLGRDRPHLFVTKNGIWAWPEFSPAWLSNPVLTWKDLRPYLDEADAERIGWPAR